MRVKLAPSALHSATAGQHPLASGLSGRPGGTSLLVQVPRFIPPELRVACERKNLPAVACGIGLYREQNSDIFYMMAPRKSLQNRHGHQVWRALASARAYQEHGAIEGRGQANNVPFRPSRAASCWHSGLLLIDWHSSC